MDEPVGPPESTQAQIARLVVFESQVPASQAPANAFTQPIPDEQEDDVVDEDIIDIDDALVEEQPHVGYMAGGNAALASGGFYDGDHSASSSKPSSYAKGSSRATDEQQEVNVDENEELDAGIADDDVGLVATDDMWDNVEVDSEFEGLSDDDIYADMEGDADDMGDKAEPGVVEAAHTQSGTQRHHRPHHSLSSHGNHEATQPMIDAVSSYMAKKPGSGAGNAESEFSDEEEAAYATQVERYTEYSHINETHRAAVAMDVDSEDTEDEDEEMRLARPARARRSRPEHEKQEVTRKRATKNVPVRTSKTTPIRKHQAVSSHSEDDPHHHGSPSMALRERKHVRAPQTEEDLGKIRAIVRKEFETALESKRKELSQIEANLEETRRLWERLQITWANRVWDDHRLEPRVQAVDELRNAKKRGRPLKRERFTTSAQLKQEQNILSMHAEKIANESLEPPKKRKRGEALEPRPLYCLTAHKGFVQVICPDCKRFMFGNQLGFINHCRIMHLIKFATWEDAVELCGQPVDESVVPLDDPCRTDSAALIGYRITQQKNEAAARAASSQTGSTGGPHSDLHQQGKGSAQGGFVIDHLHPENNPANRFSTSLDPTSSSFNHATSTSSNVLSAEGSRFFIKKQLILGNSSKALSPAEKLSEDPLVTLIRPTGDVPTHRWMVYLRAIGDEDLSNYIDKVRFFLHPTFKPRDIVEVMRPPFQLVRESSHEFPVRVQIFFNDPRNKAMSFVHYVVFQTSNAEAVGEEYIIDVEINRDYTQNMVLDDNISLITTTPTSQLASAHHLTHTRELQQQKYQQYLESPPASSKQPFRAGMHSDSETGGYGSDQFSSSRPIRYLRMHDHLTMPPSGGEISSFSYDRLVDFVRHACEIQCPIISNNLHPLMLPYSIAKSTAEWASWTHGKRHSVEWQRALRLSRLLYDSHHVRRSTREMLDLCRHLNLTPIVDGARGLHAAASGGATTEPLIPGDPNSPFITPLSSYQRSYYLPLLRARLEKMEALEQQQVLRLIRYCRFCGCVHLPFDKIDELEIVCGERKLLILQETHSTFRELLERSIRQVKDENEKIVKRQAIQALSSVAAAAASSSPVAVPTVSILQSPQRASTPAAAAAKGTPTKSQAKASASTPARVSSATPTKNIVSPLAKATSFTPPASKKTSASSPSADPRAASPKIPLATPERRKGRPPKVTNKSDLLASSVSPATIPTASIRNHANGTSISSVPAQVANDADLLVSVGNNESTNAHEANGAAERTTAPLADVEIGDLETMEPAVFVALLRRMPHHQVSRLPPLPQKLLDVLPSFLSVPVDLHPDPFADLPRNGASMDTDEPAPPALKAPSLDDFQFEEPRRMIGIWNPAQQDLLLAHFRLHPEAMHGALLPQSVLEALYQVDSDNISRKRIQRLSTGEINRSAFAETSHMDPSGQELVHPIHGTMGFKLLPSPSPTLIPELHTELQKLQLLPTEPTADMLLLKLMGSFARRLLFATAAAYTEERSHDIEVEAQYKVVVPLHVATAIVRDPLHFDFLLDEGLARYTSLEMIEANALTEDTQAADIQAQLEPRLKTHRAMAAADARAMNQQQASSQQQQPSTQTASATQEVKSMDVS